MTKATIEIKDKNFRIVLPKDVRKAEKLKVGDFIEIDVKKIEPS